MKCLLVHHAEQESGSFTKKVHSDQFRAQLPDAGYTAQSRLLLNIWHDDVGLIRLL